MLRYVCIFKLVGVLTLMTGIVDRAAAAEITAERPIVVCFGDSITAGAYPDLLSKASGSAEVVNAGVGGNTTGAALNRMDADVLSRKPDVVVIMFGTNDSVLTAPGKYRTPLPDFTKNLEEMVKRCQEAGARPVLATLLPIIEAPYYTRHPREYYEPDGGLLAILARYREATMGVAEKFSLPLVDMNRLIHGDETHLKPDGVHPNKEGEAAIASHVATALEAVLGDGGQASNSLSN